MEKAIKPLLQFVYSKFEICAFNIFIVSCYSYCLWYLSHLSMKRHSLETEISQHECHSEKKNTIIMDVCIWLEFWLLNSYTLTSVCIFSILFSLNFSRCWQGEFVKQSRAFSVGEHFLYDCDLKVWLWGDTVRRNKILVTLRVKGLFTSVHCYMCHKTPWNCFQPVHWGQIQDNSPMEKN